MAAMREVLLRTVSVAIALTVIVVVISPTVAGERPAKMQTAPISKAVTERLLSPVYEPTPRDIGAPERVGAGVDVRTTVSPLPQNETCIVGDPNNANIIVGGMNDYSVVATGFAGNGVVYSHDGGATWTHSAAGVPLPPNLNDRGSDPCLEFDSQGRVFYGSLAIKGLGSPFFSDNAIAVGRSSDGGVTWTVQRIVLPGNGGTGTVGSSFVQGSEPEVATNGDVYVTFWFGGRIEVWKSVDGGVTYAQMTQPFGLAFGNIVVPSPLPNETFRVNPYPNIETNPQLAGHVYVNACADPTGTFGDGDDADTFFARSTDGGVTWGPQVTLNDDGFGKNQIFPWMSVSKKGAIHVIWYDTRNDAGNHDIDVYGAFSLDGGASFFPNFRVTDCSFDPDTGQFNGNTFFGDYNGLGTNGLNTFHALWTDTRTMGCPQGVSAREQEIYYGLDCARWVQHPGVSVGGLQDYKRVECSATVRLLSVDDGARHAGRLRQSAIAGRHHAGAEPRPVVHAAGCLYSLAGHHNAVDPDSLLHRQSHEQPILGRYLLYGHHARTAGAGGFRRFRGAWRGRWR
jgi:hypothetical protein